MGLGTVVQLNIRAEAARAGYTQVALARALSMSQGSITKRWKGITPWQVDEVGQVADLLGINVLVLFDQDAAARAASRTAPAMGEGRVARLKGLEPPTF